MMWMVTVALECCHRVVHPLLRGARRDLLEVEGAALGGMLRESTFARRARHAGARLFRHVERGDRLVGVPRDEDLFARLEEVLDPLPRVAQDRRAAGGRLEETARGAVAHLGH